MAACDKAAACEDRNQAVALWERAHDLSKQALQLFREAGKPDSEPTRSVLMRSTASIAVEAGLLVEAERLVCEALSGSPPSPIDDELRQLFQTVNHRRHLELRGVRLLRTELQLVLSGPEVGHGVAPARAVLDRVDAVDRLLARTIMRRSHRPFGRLKRTKELEPYLSVPRAASYAVTLRFSSQDAIDGLGLVELAVDEVIRCLDLFNRAEMDALSEAIPDQGYLKNFIGLSRNLAPDGRSIDLVGLTTERAGGELGVALRPRTALPLPVSVSEKAAETADFARKVVTGTLLVGDAMAERITVRDTEGSATAIRVAEGLGDLVRMLFEREVRAEIEHVDGAWHLLSMEPASAD